MLEVKWPFCFSTSNFFLTHVMFLQMLADAGLPGQMKIIVGDAMDYTFDRLFPDEISTEWSQPSPPICVIGNLPFNVSTRLTLKWIHLMSEQSGFFRHGRVPLTLTFQKEVAQRMVAPVLDHQRSRLSIMCQNWCDVKLRLNISGKYFVPAPKVDVSVVKLVPLVEPRIKLPFKVVEKFVRHLFHYRNKHIRFSLGTLFPSDLKDLNEELFLQTGIQPILTPAMLAIDEIGALCTLYQRMCEENYGLFEYNYRAQKALPKSALKKALKRPDEPPSTPAEPVI